ncbi:Crotonobetainyl-CoA:carnitine CoA-transferase CaiB and related acyl-CoA transferases [Mycobacterium rhizamassiliense]|uniref:Crotonobetainyl-CoA:carnitine CoA-transferase CaiB and related acyl-CoA transferases n=1 Tax=Mycobacterium rhizamassiliense TaxID=1841860 RepID=A0A2U3NU36_9MYCO|nr:CoA transferase [Mycobacterium rhizamassiliense]SPM34984.1 Crotonobetainyl-CoA:carnitine CoA-transferase CaiB and related acyl-CoA transferases [Mycobacterium rhizamassiliense]
MRKPLTGVRVLEVAQFTFVPSAGAVLADWGADVVKIEHPVTGDAQRGLVKVLGAAATVPGSSFAPIMEAPNRGKRSVGLALDNSEARPLLDELIRRSDVFLTNYLPSSRKKLSIDVDDVRRVNPDIIYVVGNGFGSNGPDRDAGAYDATAFWARGGSADGLTSPDVPQTPFMPAGAYGDNIGGITIAGGVAAALYGRQTTGEPSVLDVSLLAVGAWATQFSVNMAMLMGGPLPKVERRTQAPGNPLTGAYRTSDGRFVQLSMLQPTRYWPEFCRLMGLPDLAEDPRFTSIEAMSEHCETAQHIVGDTIGNLTFAECQALLRKGRGQWAPVQDAWEIANDEALAANGRIAEIVDAEGHPQKLVANPVKFDDDPASLPRAPQFAEHTDSVLRELGIDDDRLIELKIAGAIT